MQILPFLHSQSYTSLYVPQTRWVHAHLFLQMFFPIITWLFIQTSARTSSPQEGLPGHPAQQLGLEVEMWGDARDEVR